MMKSITSKHGPISKAIYTTLTGFSPSAAHEICERAYIDSEHPANELSTNDSLTLYQVLENFIMDINHNIFTPNIAYENGLPLEFAVYPMSVYKKCYNKSFESVSAMLEQYYSDKEIHTRTRQKSSDLRRIVATALERNKKKLDLQYKQFKDTEKREKYKIYGELLTTYGYSAQKGDKSITCINYYNNEEITIPLNIELSPIDNAKKYFEKYAKLKRTFEALQIQIADTTEELNHLDSISNSLEIACNEADLNAIKNEMIDAGYIKKSFSKGKGKKQAKLPHNAPLHYISSDGFDIFVGKNNFQNDDLTFGIQNTDDWWFHAKGIAGSHVVLRGNGREITDLAFEEAGALAAHYSKAKGSDKVEIDYTELRNVKKPKGGKPGFVVYYTNYSLIATSNIQSLELSEDD